MGEYDNVRDRRVALGERPFDPYEPWTPSGVRESHRGYSDRRGYLPHLDLPLTQFVTFRLHDSFPAPLLDRWRQDLAVLDEDERRREGYRRTEAYVDAGHGACWLRRPEIAGIVEEALRFNDGVRYDLIAWTLMPNHVHLLARIREGHPLPKTVQTWKARSARRANEILGRSGPFWYRDYYDRYIRDEAHLANCLRYIDMNPVKAGLCSTPAEWPWGSARLGRELQDSPGPLSGTRRGPNGPSEPIGGSLGETPSATRRSPEVYL